MQTSLPTFLRFAVDLKTGARLSLMALLLYVILQLLATFQTQEELQSPMIPAQLIWEVNKQLVFTALVSGVSCFIALALYFFRKYLFVIILSLLTLTAARYIYL